MKHTNDTLLRSVASRLKQIRIERGLTQEVVTDRTKVNVGLYEVGTTNITIVLLTVLCNFYNVTLEEFLKGIEYEISGYVTAMKHKYPELLVFLTGGDDFSFDTNLKSIIFADRFLVLKGLNRILNYNNGRI